MPDYYESLGEALRAAGIGRPCMLLDLDRVDHNIDLIAARLGTQFRVVTKSLPCLTLADYVMARADTRKLMAFDLPFVHMFLDEWRDVDVSWASRSCLLRSPSS